VLFPLMRQSTQSVQRLKHLNLQTRPRVTTLWYESIETKKAEDGSKESYCSRGALNLPRMSQRQMIVRKKPVALVGSGSARVLPPATHVHKWPQPL
jgi:environmental stress-induced protein Ves